MAGTLCFFDWLSRARKRTNSLHRNITAMKPMSQIVTLIFAYLFYISAYAGDGIDAALAAQPEEVKARYSARHPAETLRFFGIKPGMTVVEALPGRGWYSKILKQVLGADGKLIGADYASDMYPKFNFYDEATLEAKKTWVDTWTTEASAWNDGKGASVEAFQFGSMPTSMDGTADAVLLVRAFHNVVRFENDGGYMSAVLADIKRVLKPGGVVGIVQHMAPEGNSDKFADGSKGYLKRSFVLKTFKEAGFELVGESDINHNPADQPGEKDFVWRLPPTLFGVKDEAMKAKNMAIGESNRMTLLYRKP